MENREPNKENCWDQNLAPQKSLAHKLRKRKELNNWNQEYRRGYYQFYRKIKKIIRVLWKTVHQQTGYPRSNGSSPWKTHPTTNESSRNG